MASSRRPRNLKRKMEEVEEVPFLMTDDQAHSLPHPGPLTTTTNAKRLDGVVKSFTSSPIITILVDSHDGTQTFQIHEEILTAKSPYFKAFLHSRSDSTETVPKPIKLTRELPSGRKISPRTFQVVADWMYIGHAAIDNWSPSPKSEVLTAKDENAQLDHIDLYLAADVLIIDDLKAQMIECARELLKNIPPAPAAIRRLKDKIPPKEPLRQLFEKALIDVLCGAVLPGFADFANFANFKACVWTQQTMTILKDDGDLAAETILALIESRQKLANAMSSQQGSTDTASLQQPSSNPNTGANDMQSTHTQVRSSRLFPLLRRRSDLMKTVQK